MELVPRERATSSEPCSGSRPNPFDDVTEQTSRKRQRTSRRGSRSISIETAVNSDTGLKSSFLEEEERQMEDDPLLPSTPDRIPSNQLPAEPTSSRVTINLRTNPSVEQMPSSPPSPTIHSKMVNSGNDVNTAISVESESDALSTTAAVETPSASPSSLRSPSPVEIELVSNDEEDSDFADGDSALAIIGDDQMYFDPLSAFPYHPGPPQTIFQAHNRLVRYFQFDEIVTDEAFCKMRDWISSTLSALDTVEAFYDAYIKSPDFWQKVPELIWALSYRSRFFGDFLRRNNASRRALSDMFVQFARLTGRFLAMDLKTWTDHAKAGNLGQAQEPKLGSRLYLICLSWLIRKEEMSHIGRNLENHYDWDWDADTTRMADAFQEAGGSISNITSVVRYQRMVMPGNPKIFDVFTEPTKIVHKLAADAATLLENEHVVDTNVAVRTLQLSYEFFQTMSDGLEAIIEKHVNFLSPDAALCHLSCLTSIMHQALLFDSDATLDLVLESQKLNPTIPRKHIPLALSRKWKFMVLKKLIRSSQMQLRVIGVTQMCTDLLELYRERKGLDPATSPILLFFAKFIIDNELVEYLVGIGSHPEIINESNNIVGFLIVTKTYPPEQTDKIWQTVMASQDPRVVEATLRMVKACMNLFDLEPLLYLCEKANDVPISSYTAAMREYCSCLFKEIMGKLASRDDFQPLETPPYDLCIRLIRETSKVSAECLAGNAELQDFAVQKLSELLAVGPSPAARNAMYLDCISDISNRGMTATGSICVIDTLLQCNENDLHVLATQHSLTQLLVEELESRVKTGHQSTRSPITESHNRLLARIIESEPSSIPTELGKRLWNVLVGSDSTSNTVRNRSWQILNNAMNKLTARNLFLETCLKDHLPNLPPRCFNHGVLDFVNEAIDAWMQEVRQDFNEGERSFESHALEQLWRMILNAPTDTIDAPAINLLVDVYVNSVLITTMPCAKALKIHLALVARCLEQLKGAASKLKAFSDGASTGPEEGMVIVASEFQFLEQEMIFARSLAVLREFLRAYHSKPHFATPNPRSFTATAKSMVEGEPFTVKYQSFDGDKHTDVQSLTLGRLNTAASLLASLQKVTGFTHYRIYHGGKEFNPDEIDVCKSLEDLHLNGLILIHRREHTDGSAAPPDGSKSKLELEIMKHFDDLWSYLSMHERVAREIYWFLIKFPVYERLLKEFGSEATYSKLFPVGQPFKSLYAVHSLREFIRIQSQTGSSNEVVLTRAISLIVAAISNPEVLDHCASDDLKYFLAFTLTSCLVQFLKEPIIPKAVASYLNGTLLGRLVQLLQEAKEARLSQHSVQLTSSSLEAILEASSHSKELWTSFSSHPGTRSLLRNLLLEDPRPVVRKGAGKQIVNKCMFSSSLAEVSAIDFMVAFWPMLQDLVPRAILRPQQCDETLTLTLSLFKKLAETSIGILRIEDLVKQWGALLMSHSCTERVGHPESIDPVAHGLSLLLNCAATFAKASQQSLSCSAMGTELFRRHLFPGLSEDCEVMIIPKIPLLNLKTRQILTEAVWLLTKDDETQYNALLTSLADLVPYDANHDNSYIYDLAFHFERAKSIRSPTGYAGLRNLSNTCYLNSLFTQLFMNIPFREFMLDAHVADGGASQKLLMETQVLFSYMQNSFRRYIDPAQLAGSIRTYEETQIDVNIQMDVDEFYNLLFDRWEGQILAPDAKQKFRSFYGGQLVQQVKSKECSHISERLEPFSAIQCDIKGKSCLQESLQAYVDGEIMEGDNKYKCSTCDRHVDAVKRACLKDIPDNLIFHLKRFDFNLRTLQRSKINDHFSFPQKIDMRPYKVEHLMDNPDGTHEDVFELVGILVHSGTAESGHYYSYIRERPSTGENDNWVEFNDETVTAWDLSCIENACFGGPDNRGPHDNANPPFDKSWSAYMLFYQRSSTLLHQKSVMEDSGLLSPVRLPVPTKLSNHISMENEILMRRYCLYDPSHAVFVTKMLTNTKQLNGGQCSSNHALEKLALTSSFNYLDQVVARAKDLPDHHNFMYAIRQLCLGCAECSRDYLEWYCDYPETLRHLLLRNPDVTVRSETASSILAALDKVKTDASYAYGLGDDEESGDEVDEIDPRLIQRFVRALNKLWDLFHTTCRAWPEYFGLLASISNLGKLESALLLDAGFLRKTLEIVSADPLLPLPQQYSKMLNIIQKRMSTRPVSYAAVIALLSQLLRTCDLSADSVRDTTQRFELAINDRPIPLTNSERHLLMQHWTRTDAHIIVEKLLHINQNWAVTEQIILDLLNFPDGLDGNIFSAIDYGLRKGYSSGGCEPFLKAALLYCEHSKAPQALYRMVIQVAKIAGQFECMDGKEFLNFFKNVSNLPCDDTTVSKQELRTLVYGTIVTWGPALLSHYDGLVRTDADNYIRDIILQHGPDPNFGPSEEEAELSSLVTDVARRLGIHCLDYLHNTYIKQRQQAVRAHLTIIQEIITACSQFYDFDDTEDEQTCAFFRDSNTTIFALKKLIVEEAEEEASDWDGSEEYDDSSEPMDKTGELSAINDDELQL